MPEMQSDFPVLNEYPIFIPSRGRADRDLSFTANILEREGIPFHLVVEPPEAESYVNLFGAERVLVLPFQDRGHVAPARTWIKRHSQSLGHKRHWQFDDNVRGILFFDGREKHKLPIGHILRKAEEFVDRYSNVAIAGFRHCAYVWTSTAPFSLNHQVASVVLVDNTIQCEWRGFVEDVDYVLQVLTRGYCTILFNAFYYEKPARMTMKGGNTDTVYAHDAALALLARDLQWRWPGLVKISRRYGGTRFNVAHVWRKFRTPLIPVQGEPS